MIVPNQMSSFEVEYRGFKSITITGSIGRRNEKEKGTGHWLKIDETSLTVRSLRQRRFSWKLELGRSVITDRDEPAESLDELRGTLILGHDLNSKTQTELSYELRDMKDARNVRMQKVSGGVRYLVNADVTIGLTGGLTLSRDRSAPSRNYDVVSIIGEWSYRF